MAVWDKYFQAGTFISWSQLQRLKYKKFAYRCLDCSHLLKSVYSGLYSWFTGKSQLVTDIEHPYINPRTILQSDHKCGVKRCLQITVAGTSQVLESQQGADTCCTHCYPLCPPTRIPTSRREFPLDGMVTDYWKEAKETQSIPKHSWIVANK